MSSSHDVMFEPLASLVGVHGFHATRRGRRVERGVKVEINKEGLMAIEVPTDVNN